MVAGLWLESPLRMELPCRIYGTTAGERPCAVIGVAIAGADEQISGAMRDVDPSVVARWIQRALWVVLPLAVGPVVEAAVDGRSGPVRIAVALLAWTGWGVGLVATLVPRATSLTVLRVLGPGAAAVAVAAALLAGDDGASATGAVAVVAGALAAASVFAPAAVDSHVDGSSYGTERRFSLRCPPVLAALGAGTWLLVAAAVVTGPLLLAARQWAAGAASLAAGAIVAALGVRSLHQLARRWIVFVPSGVVIHDPVARPDSVMAPRPTIVRIAPARADSGALDLTVGAPGLALEMGLREPLPVSVRERGGEVTTHEAEVVAFTPLRATAVLAEVERRHLDG